MPGGAGSKFRVSTELTIFGCLGAIQLMSLPGSVFCVYMLTKLKYKYDTQIQIQIQNSQLSGVWEVRCLYPSRLPCPAVFSIYRVFIFTGTPLKS